VVASTATTDSAQVLNKQRIVFTYHWNYRTDSEFNWRLPSYQEIFDKHLFREDCHPQLGDITYILGPCGSGKAFFALGAVATRDDRNMLDSCRVIQGMSATAYVKLSTFPAFVTEKDDNERLQWLRKELSKVADIPIETKLDVHISLVLDDSESVGSYFEQKCNVAGLYAKMKDELSASFRLILCGTGVFGRELVGGSDCRKIHMKDWSQEDFWTVAKKKWKFHG
jgi:hypothetical protein